MIENPSRRIEPPAHYDPMLSLVAFPLALIAIVAGCGPHESSTPKPIAPAKVERLPVETELTRITLTAQAEQRLGITLVKVVVRKDLARRRTLGGDLVTPPGKSIIVAAPVPGTISPPMNGVIPAPGTLLAAGDPVLIIVPLLSPERDVPTPAERVQMANARATLLAARIVAEGDVQRGKAEDKAAAIALARAQKLLADMVGAAQAVDDAEARVSIAKATLQAAEDRLKELTRLANLLDVAGANGQPAPLHLTSPQAGILRSLSVSRQQTVNTGAPLFEVVDTSVLWVRVPVYVDALAELKLDSAARLVGLGARDEKVASPARLLRPVKVSPPGADPLSSTVDVFYEVANPDGKLRPGQRVGVAIDRTGVMEGLVVPASAILYDVNGGTWLYAKTGEHAFERRRVAIDHVQGSDVILSAGPPAGTDAVVAGAAELFGTEFGAGK